MPPLGKDGVLCHQGPNPLLRRESCGGHVVRVRLGLATGAGEDHIPGGYIGLPRLRTAHLVADRGHQDDTWDSGAHDGGSRAGSGGVLHVPAGSLREAAAKLYHRLYEHIGLTSEV